MNYMKKIYLILIALVAVVSCDLLDKQSKDTLSIDAYFKTETDLQLFSNTFYNNLLNKTPYDDLSDQLINDKLNNLLKGGSNRTVPASSSLWSWGDLRKMNTLLHYAELQCEDEEALVKYSAVTRMFRAYFYFEKVQNYGNVPWIDKELGSADEQLYAPRDSREYVMSKMIDDIDYAIEHLSADLGNIYRVNKWSALALKSRFCLFEGTYRKYHGEVTDYTAPEGVVVRTSEDYLRLAAEAAKEIIDGGKYKLYSTGNPDVDYLMLFGQMEASKDEYILALNFDYGLGITHDANGWTMLGARGRPGYTKKIVNTYLMKDGTRFTDQTGWQTKTFVEEMQNRDPRLAQTVRGLGYKRIGGADPTGNSLSNSVTGYSPIKFVTDPKGGADTGDKASNDMPVFRYGEVLLNYAEALAELGTLTQEDLNISVNLLRKRVGMPDMNLAAANANPDWYLKSADYGYSNVSGNNEGIILEIRRERTVELAQEGFRWNDLMRWKEGKCIDQEMYGMYFPGPGAYDIDGDGKDDVCLYVGAKPEMSGVEFYEIGKDVKLTDGNNGGYLHYHEGVDHFFTDPRDYLYPIPINEASLNPNLGQNPGWPKH